MIFAGEFEHRIDPQGRVSIPARFQPAFAEGIVLSKAYDRCLVAYTDDEWERVAASIATQPQNLAGSRRLARLTFSGSYPSSLDRHGRVLIPPPLREYAGLGDDVVIIGTGRFLEIWDSAAWQDEKQALDSEAAEIAEHAPAPGVALAPERPASEEGSE